MNPIISFLLAEIVVVPMVMGIVKYNKMEKSYRPFVILLLAAVLSELSSYIFFIRLGIPNAYVFKVYSLLECFIVLFLFHGWGFLNKRQNVFFALLIICFLFWLTENIIYFGPDEFPPFFPIFYSFIIVLISINQINYCIMTSLRKSLFKNAEFLICIGFVIYFIYQILYEAAYFVYNTNKEYRLTTDIINSFGYINFAVNLLYIPAVYFIPKRKEFFFWKKYNFESKNRNE